MGEGIATTVLGQNRFQVRDQGPIIGGMNSGAHGDIWEYSGVRIKSMTHLPHQGLKKMRKVRKTKSWDGLQISRFRLSKLEKRSLERTGR